MRGRVEGVDALAVHGITAPFGDGRGIVDLSLAVAAGERVAVLGASGAGKTTLLRAIAGLARCTAGRVLVRGRDVTALPPEQRETVYLHQSPILFSHLTVADNVAFPLRVRGERGTEANKHVQEMLAALHVDELASRMPATLSGGQRHRVALARAMVARPAAMLLDEPLSALDPSLRAEVRVAIIEAQSSRGDTMPAVVLVTHDLDDAALLADRIAILIDGAFAQVATPDVLFACPNSLAVARFLGLFQELPGRIRGDGAVTCALGVVPAQHGYALSVCGSAVVAYKANAVHLEPLATEGAVPARIVRVQHRAHGSTALLHIDDGSAHGAVVECALPVTAEPPSIDSRIGVRLDTARALVFPR